MSLILSIRFKRIFNRFHLPYAKIAPGIAGEA